MLRACVLLALLAAATHVHAFSPAPSLAPAAVRHGALQLRAQHASPSQKLAAAAAALLLATAPALAAAPGELIPDKVGNVNVNDALCKSGIFTNAFEYRCTPLGNLDKLAGQGKELQKDEKDVATKLEEKMAAKRAAREAAAAAAAAAADKK